jgi:hypothetical protein
MAELPNLGYHGIIHSHAGISGVPAKIYFSEIFGEGRDPKMYEWGASGLSREVLLDSLKIALGGSPHKGRPHVIVGFPHVVAGARFGNSDLGERETNLYTIGSCDPHEIIERRDFGLFEKSDLLGCPLEVLIYWREMAMRAAALKSGVGSTEDALWQYLTNYIPSGEGIEIADPNLVWKVLQEKG